MGKREKRHLVVCFGYVVRAGCHRADVVVQFWIFIRLVGAVKLYFRAPYQWIVRVHTCAYVDMLRFADFRLRFYFKSAVFALFRTAVGISSVGFFQARNYGRIIGIGRFSRLLRGVRFPYG